MELIFNPKRLPENANNKSPSIHVIFEKLNSDRGSKGRNKTKDWKNFIYVCINGHARAFDPTLTQSDKCNFFCVGLIM